MATLFPMMFPSKIQARNAEIIKLDTIPAECMDRPIGPASGCSVCNEFPRTPYAFPLCGHLICGEDWAGLQRASDDETVNCPYCRTPAKISEVQSLENMEAGHRLLLNEFILTCPDRCGYRGNLQEINNHQVYNCSMREIACPNNGCFEVGTAQRIEQHYRGCPFIPLVCSACQTVVPRGPVTLQHDCIHELKIIIRGSSPPPYPPIFINY